MDRHNISLFPACRENVAFEGYLKNMTEWHNQNMLKWCAGYQPF